jgi:hypothetical protein
MHCKQPDCGHNQHAGPAFRIARDQRNEWREKMPEEEQQTKSAIRDEQQCPEIR